MLILKVQICSNTMDVSENNSSITEISCLLMHDFIHKKLWANTVNCIQLSLDSKECIEQEHTHTCIHTHTHLKPLPATAFTAHVTSHTVNLWSPSFHLSLLSSPSWWPFFHHFTVTHKLQSFWCLCPQAHLKAFQGKVLYLLQPIYVSPNHLTSEKLCSCIH